MTVAATRGETRDVRVPTTHCLPLCCLPPRVTDLADVGLHIFNYFFSNPAVSSSVSFFLSLFLLFSCSLLLLHEPAYEIFLSRLSFSVFELLGNACVSAHFTPKSGYFRSEKRAKKVWIRYTRHEGVASGPRTNEARGTSNERRPEPRERTVYGGC